MQAIMNNPAASLVPAAILAATIVSAPITPASPQSSALTGGIDLRAICPAYVAPAELRKHKQAGPTQQVTARPIKGGRWEGIYRDTDGTGAESAGHATEADAVRAVAFYFKRAA